MRNLHETHSSEQLSIDIGRRKKIGRKKEISKITSYTFNTVIYRQTLSVNFIIFTINPA